MRQRVNVDGLNFIDTRLGLLEGEPLPQEYEIIAMTMTKHRFLLKRNLRLRTFKSLIVYL
ncbi:CLUMA_CG018463, isoform A [Clunio marinus]|uniref:CLUMA_CG018463, isoform A n=1 Tax=Clunio marinus TaxID=568069 RepID=A0A1J1IY06_9DIPT|nr:CLUMA_CG018463, isoform A [Clunio marinus]